jgi:lipopolysaccharide/colanic/teichoic acid biosynthesis glycosyltransferase
VRASFIGSFAWQRRAPASRYLHRHRVKPGITGWAQVSGLRGEVDTLEKVHARVAHDLCTSSTGSLWLDLKILLKTVGNSRLA